MKSPSELLKGRPGTVISVLLFCVVVGTYWNSTHNGFVNLDDPAFVYSNPYVQGGLTWQGAKWAFTTMDRGFWQPIAWLSLMLDSQLFGAKAGGYHFTSLFIHAVTTVLWFLVLRAMTEATWRSAVVAALFGLHPLHVESVAWVSERKDVLSALFWVLTMFAYVLYVRRRKGTGPAPADATVESGTVPVESRGGPPSRYYWLAVVFFVCGLMSKSMVVTLPIMLLLVDWWPLRRVEPGSVRVNWQVWRPLIREKLPFFILAFVFGVMTIIAQKTTGAVKDVENFPIFTRVANALYAYVTYLFQMIWPRSLAAFYSYPKNFPALEVIGAVALLAVISVMAFLAARRRPHVAFGWIWYGVTLLPVVGLIQVGSQAHADRYTYIPLIGIFIALAWGIYDLTVKVPNQRAALAAVGGGVIVLCAVLTRGQIGFWKDSETLFRHALAVTKNNELAHNNYGTALFRSGRLDEAIVHFQKAAQLKPSYAVARANLGSALISKHRYPEAISQLQEAIKINPKYAGAYRNIGTAFGQQGKTDAAIPYFQKAISLDPNDPESHYAYGVSLLEKGKLDESIAEYRKAVELKPNYAAAQANLGSTLLMKGNLDEAIIHLATALQLGGKFPAAYRNLGTALAQKGRLEEAISNLLEAVRLAPNDLEAHYNLGVAFLQKGFLDEGIQQFREALRIRPGYSAAQKNLNVALAAKAGGMTNQAPRTKQ